MIESNDMRYTVASLRNYLCSRCRMEKACVVKIEDKLICLNCRYDDIGKEALYEALYSGV